MKKCEYCGKMSDDNVPLCAGCGTAFDAPREVHTSSTVADEKSVPILNAKNASAILVTYLATQFICTFVLVLISDTLAPAATLSSVLLGGLVMVLLSKSLIPKSLKDASPYGAAWIAGRWSLIIKGLIIGVIIGIFDQSLIIITKPYVAYRNLDSFHRMAFSPGLEQTAYCVISVLLAPIIEEMLFRGVLYGGYRRSFGPIWAAVIVSLLFVALHLHSYIHFAPNVVGVIVATLATLWCRLHWKAIGPAVAVHAGYNLMAVVLVVYKTWHRL